MSAGTVDVHAHILLPETMGACGAAGPEMGVRDGVSYFRSGDYVLTHVPFAGSPFSDVPRRLALMDRMGIDQAAPLDQPGQRHVERCRRNIQ